MNMSWIFGTHIVSSLDLEMRFHCTTLLVGVLLVVFLCSFNSLANINRFLYSDLCRSNVQGSSHRSIVQEFCR